jgi:cobalt/nickel transport system ATP-binding protein
MRPILHVVDLHFSYPGASTPALAGANFSILPGQKIALLGRNGAGKSTLLLHGNGLLRPRRGVVHIAGEPLTYDRAGLLRVRQQVGLVFQNPDDQLFSASVRQEISFGPLNLGLDRATVEQRVAEAAAQCHITDLLARPTHALSGGQKARVALAGVLAMQPKVLLADEAIAGLDPWMRAQILTIFDTLASQGMAIVLSTHDLTVAQSWADQVSLMEAGQVVVVAPPHELFANAEWRQRCGLDLVTETGLRTGEVSAHTGPARSAPGSGH